MRGDEPELCDGLGAFPTQLSRSLTSVALLCSAKLACHQLRPEKAVCPQGAGPSAATCALQSCSQTHAQGLSEIISCSLMWKRVDKESSNTGALE